MAFTPENDLERSLTKAAHDPAFRAQFYRDLVTSNIFLIQHGETARGESGARTLKEPTTLQVARIEFNGNSYIPIFSSLSRLQAALTGEASFVEMNALEFMRATHGAPLLLNPGSECGKEFTAKETASIVDGTIWQLAERHVMERGARVAIGQPKNEPTALLRVLTPFFKTRRNVRRAWLAHYFNPDDGLPPHTLVVLDVANGFGEVAQEMAIIVKDVDLPDPPMDIVELRSFADPFIKKSKPFYQRRLLGLF